MTHRANVPVRPARMSRSLAIVLLAAAGFAIAAGVYYLSLIDAHDSGGPAHAYRLVVKSLP